MSKEKKSFKQEKSAEIGKEDTEEQRAISRPEGDN